MPAILGPTRTGLGAEARERLASAVRSGWAALEVEETAAGAAASPPLWEREELRWVAGVGASRGDMCTCGNTAGRGGGALRRSSRRVVVRSTLALRAETILGMSEVEAALGRGWIVSCRTSLFMYFVMLVCRLLKRPGLRAVVEGLLWPGTWLAGGVGMGKQDGGGEGMSCDVVLAVFVVVIGQSCEGGARGLGRGGEAREEKGDAEVAVAALCWGRLPRGRDSSCTLPWLWVDIRLESEVGVGGPMGDTRLARPNSLYRCP